MWRLLFSVCLFVPAVYGNVLQTVNGKIKITLGISAGCRDSSSFLNTQLGPTYDLYKDFLELEFVPWGRTVRNADGSLSCQFRENDCWANRLHRCVLNYLKGNQAAQLQYLLCEYGTPRPAYEQGSYRCVQEVGMRLIEADYCVNNPSLDTLDEDAAAAAAEPMAIINFVPSIHFNDVIDRPLHNEARQRLSSMICLALANDSTTGVTDCKVR